VTPDRIAELLAPFLDTSYLEQTRSATTDALFRNISTYIDILLRWNSRINLTAIRDPEEIVTRHFGESLFAARHLLPAATSRIRVADVGSGAGFPGLPIKLWNPEISLNLIESNHKKATFLREVSRTLTLTDINILNARAENLPENQKFDIVTLRAVERFDEIFPVASKLVAIHGSIGLLIGDAQIGRATSLGREFRWQPPLPIPQSHSRVLLLGQR
jgi:16S rRNA (guanine527-N7)-methyltransferase